MPYIVKSMRESLERGSALPENAGELNFIITKICHDYLRFKGIRYVNLNEIIGVLECAKQELYRMIAAPYENIKRIENGCISELDKC